MKVTKLFLRNFRNHKKLELTFDQNLNLIVGDNGIGKTNILEAIYFVATAKSTRARYDKDLIEHESKFCTIETEIENQDDIHKLEIQIVKSEMFPNSSSKKVKVNKTPKTISYFTGIFNAVMFSPQDLDIVTGTPSERRKYVDLLLTQVDSAYKRALNSYTKIIRQRNKVLENISETQKGYSQLEIYDEQVLELGKEIQIKRSEFFKYAQNKATEIIDKLDPSLQELTISYKKNEMSQSRLESHREAELGAKTTLVGPHRDDFAIESKGFDIAEFGSRGQQRTIILLLKLIEIAFIEDSKGERPVLLMDDIFSELDERHKRSVMEIIPFQQTFISSAENISFLDNLNPTRISL